MNNRNSLLPNLQGLCKSDLNPYVLSSSSRQCSLSICVDRQTVFIGVVYANTTYLKRRSLWNELIDLQANNLGSWCIIGDFIVVLGSHEVKGSSLPLKASCDDFKAFTNIGNLTHLATRGSDYTWSNG